MKKKLITILMVAFIGIILLACEKKHIDKEYEINIYKEYYTEEKNHREDSLELEKGDSKIEVDINVTSGELKVLFLNKDNEELSYEYSVKEGNTARDTIQLDSATLENNWVLVTEKDENTDATVKYVIK
jgi:hypothetical protein